MGLYHLSERGLRAYAVATNKFADMAGYDKVELSLELADICSMLMVMGYPSSA